MRTRSVMYGALIEKACHRTTLGLILSLGLSSSCVQVEPQADFDEARRLVAESTGRGEVFDPQAPGLSGEELDSILADGLSLDEALHLALVNNRDLQADFQEIGIAHADWVQAQLLTNPSLDVLLRFPSDGGRSMVEGLVGVELLELWQIPLREESARLSLDATVLRIARRAGESLAETRAAYYDALAADESLRVALEGVELASLSYEAVESLHEAGVADALDQSLARGPLLSAQLEVRTARIVAANAHRALAKRLSVARPVEELWLTDALPQRAAGVIDSEVCVQQALESRLDLQAIATAVEALDARWRLERRKAWGDAGVGLSAERPAGSGATLVGPSLSLSLPLFDQNQAQVASAWFRLEQMVKLHEAAQITVAQDARSSADRVNTAASNLAFYERELLPQMERSLALARESYAAGQSTLLALIEVERQLLEARRAHIDLRLEAASSLSDMERVVGAPVGEFIVNRDIEGAGSVSEVQQTP